MAVLAESVRRGVIGQARQQIKAAAGSNKLLSRSEQKALPTDLRAAADAARCHKGPGARVSVNDVVDAFAAAATAQMRAVNTRGPKWLSIRETEQLDDSLQSRAWSVRAQILTGGGLTSAEIRQAAARFVATHNEDVGGSIYPGPNDGEMGSQTALVAGDAAATLAKFTQLMMGSSAPDVIKNFDPATQSMIALRATWDEEQLYVSVIDHKSGKVTHVDDLGMVDASYMIDEADFVALFNGLDKFDSYDGYYDEIDHFELIDVLMAKGTPLDIGGDEIHFSPYSNEASLTMLREKYPAADIDAMFQEAQAAFAAAAGSCEVTWAFHVDELQEDWKSDKMTLQFAGAFKNGSETDYFHAKFAVSGDSFEPMVIDVF